MNNHASESRPRKEATLSPRMSVVRKKRRLETAETNAKALNDHGATRATSTSTVTGSEMLLGKCVAVTERYEKLFRIGRGSYGIVYKARNKQTGSFVALKRCLLKTPRQSDEPVTDEVSDISVILLREMETLRLCASCPYTVSLLDVAISTSSLFLILSYVEHDLADLIDAYHHTHRRSPFTEEACKTLLIHLLSALAFLHDECYLMHRDVKMSNLLYSSRGRLLLADFGLARHYDPNSSSNNSDSGTRFKQLTPKVASLWYRPPEVLLGFRSSYTPLMDVWGAGCAWVELLTGQPALAGTSEVDQIARLLHEIGTPEPVEDFPLLANGSVTLPSLSNGSWQNRPRKYRILDRVPCLTDAGSQLLVSLLQLHPAHRWTARQALRSPYLTEDPLPLSERQMPRFPVSKAPMSKSHPPTNTQV